MDNPLIIPNPHKIDENLKEKQYKYSILLNLRDHEHSVLWQKFNVFLGFNTITIAVIAAVLSFQKFSTPTTTPTTPISFPFGFPIEVFVLFTFIFAIAFLSSVFLLIILKGSNFWINFWESKLYSSEFFVSSDGLSPIEIFHDHASRVKQKIKDQKEKLGDLIKKQENDQNNIELNNEISNSEKELEEFQAIIRDAKKKGYISTRNSMEYLVKAIMSIWAGLFVISATLTLYLLLNINGAIEIIILCLLVECVLLCYWYFAKYKNSKEIEKLLSKTIPITQNDEN